MPAKIGMALDIITDGTMAFYVKWKMSVTESGKLSQYSETLHKEIEWLPID